jgi:hypothetical protein
MKFILLESTLDGKVDDAENYILGYESVFHPGKLDIGSPTIRIHKESGDDIIKLLNVVYAKGKADKASEIRKALGL